MDHEPKGLEAFQDTASRTCVLACLLACLLAQVLRKVSALFSPMLQHFAQLTSSMNSHSQATGGDQAMLLVANFPLHSDNSLFAPQANAIYLELERLGFRCWYGE